MIAPKIPDRSLFRIMVAVHDLDGVHDELDRHVQFSSWEDERGFFWTRAIVNTVSMDGRQVEEELHILYRNGLFRKAFVTDGDKILPMKRLSQVLTYLDSPGDQNGL